MKKFNAYIKDYARTTDPRILAGITLLTGILIYLNYRHGLENRLSLFFSHPLPGYFLLFASAFTLAYGITAFFTKKNYFASPRFLFLLLAGPMVFALKAGNNVPLYFFDDSPDGFYWNELLYWPLRLFFIAIILYFIYKKTGNSNSFFGLTRKNFTAKPYLIILLLMIPLIVFASMQQDFLDTYPKLKNIAGYTAGLTHSWFYNLLYELSYGSDFISIELFFRGFLVFAFVRFAGKDAILPMACFYCTIHFGKPLFECISSFPGGLLLGIISYNTGSILGGLIVHLGLAWMMELGGYAGNLLN